MSKVIIPKTSNALTEAHGLAKEYADKTIILSSSEKDGTKIIVSDIKLYEDSGYKQIFGSEAMTFGNNF